MKRPQASAVLQRFWNNTRGNSTARLVKRFLTLGPTSTRIQQMPFQQAEVYLREPSTLAVTKACLHRIHRLIILRHDGRLTPLTAYFNIRVFHIASLMVHFPTHVFETMGPLEQAVCDAGAPMLHAFERICQHIHAGLPFAHVPLRLTRDFHMLLRNYLKAYKAWKVPDERKLTIRFSHALFTLYEGLQLLSDDDDDELEESPMKKEFRFHIQRLRTKLENVAGSEALRAFDDELAQRMKKRMDEGATRSARSFRMRLTQEQTAHELLLDPTFHFDVSLLCTSENIMYETVEREFFDSIEKELRLDPPLYVRFFKVLEEICSGLHDLSTDCGILELVDLAFVKQQTEAGLYTWPSTQKLFTAIADVIQRIQSPKRVQETASMWHALQAVDVKDQQQIPTALCHHAQFFLNRLNVMRLDRANTHLSLLVPTMMLHGVDYEREQFDKKLQNGTLTLERTTAWIHRAITHPQDVLAGSNAAYVQVHTHAVLSLITGQDQLTPDTCPETLLLDVKHLSSLQRAFHSQALAATLMMTVETLVPPTDLAKNKEGLVEILTVDCLYKVVEESLENIQALFLLNDALVQHLRECTLPAHRVHAIITKRLVECWTLDTLPPESTSALGKLFGFLYPSSLVQSVRKFKRILEVNRNVHLPIYNRIIAEEARKKMA